MNFDFCISFLNKNTHTYMTDAEIEIYFSINLMQLSYNGSADI